MITHTYTNIFFFLNLSSHLSLSSLQKIFICCAWGKNRGLEKGTRPGWDWNLYSVFRSCFTWLVILGRTLSPSVASPIGRKSPFYCPYLANNIFKLSFKEESYFILLRFSVAICFEVSWIPPFLSVDKRHSLKELKCDVCTDWTAVLCLQCHGILLKICIHNKHGVANTEMGYRNKNRWDLLWWAAVCKASIC